MTSEIELTSEYTAAGFQEVVKDILLRFGPDCKITPMDGVLTITYRNAVDRLSAAKDAMAKIEKEILDLEAEVEVEHVVQTLLGYKAGAIHGRPQVHVGNYDIRRRLAFRGILCDQEGNASL